jgi:hypothetical protein
MVFIWKSWVHLRPWGRIDRLQVLQLEFLLQSWLAGQLSVYDVVGYDMI